MQDFDLLEFLSHNYISLGTLANQNMWRSYCYGDIYPTSGGGHNYITSKKKQENMP
jgi:hypothetical protein